MSNVRKTIGRLSVIVVALALSLNACSSNDGSSATPSNVPSTEVATTATQDPAEASRAESSLAAKAQDDKKQAQNRANGIESRVKAERTLDQRLSVIVTEYCNTGGGNKEGGLSEVDRQVRALLDDMFKRYWKAGGKWNTPLSSAGKQQGGCPDTYPNPSAKPNIGTGG